MCRWVHFLARTEKARHEVPKQRLADGVSLLLAPSVRSRFTGLLLSALEKTLLLESGPD
jgi:hypothetical protein